MINEIIQLRSQMAVTWSVHDCLVEAFQAMLDTQRIRIDGPVHLALIEYCGVDDEARSDSL